MSWVVCWLALSINIYTEAGGEDRRGMEMVSDTVITRVQNEKYPDTVCDVVFQPNQFNWTKHLKTKDFNGLIAYQQSLFNKRKFNDKERLAFMKASAVAFKSMKPDYKPKYKYLHFYSGTDKPKWAKGKKAVRHGNHYFIRK